MEIRQSVTSRGLPVITVNLPNFSTATVAVYSKVGSRHEMARENGISHFLEHMAFKGTNTLSSLDIVRTLELLGSDINARTSNTDTVFYVTGLARHIGTSVSILGAALTDSTFTPDDVEVERDVILQEIRRYEDSPNARCHHNLFSTMYGDDPLGRRVLGTAETVSAFGPDDFRSFMRKHYAANRMFIMATGCVDHDTVVRMVEEAFAALPVVADGGGSYTTPVMRTGQRIDNKSFEQVTLFLALAGVGELSSDYVAQCMFASVLGSGMSSPLFQEVREKRGLVYSVGAHEWSVQDVGNVLISAGTTAEHVKELLRVAIDEVKRIANHGPTADDFERARNGEMVTIATMSERPHQLAFSLGHNLSSRGLILTPADMMAEIEAITPEHVRLTAQRVLAADAAISLVGPVDEDDYVDLVNRYRG